MFLLKMFVKEETRNWEGKKVKKKELIQEVLKVFNEVRDQIWDPRNMERKRLQTPYSITGEVRGQIIDVYV